MADYREESLGMPRSKELEYDPDYEKIFVDHRSEELELLKQDAKAATIQKIKHVVSQCFAQEIEHKEAELTTVQKALTEAKSLMDNLRACIVTKYYYQAYFNTKEESDSQDWIHPVAKQYTGKGPTYGDVSHALAEHDYPKLEAEPLENKLYYPPAIEAKKQNVISSGPTIRKNIKLLVGNISKYILNEERSSSQDQATHKWMVYVRPQETCAEDNDLISRVVVFLHPSYKPNDLIEVNKPPFCVCRRGWGEFPIRVQIHFHNSRNKPVDVIHQLKLDKTFTGLQTLGGETLIEVPLYTSKEEKPTMSSQTNKVLENSLKFQSSLASHNLPWHKQKKCYLNDNEMEPKDFGDCNLTDTSLSSFKDISEAINLNRTCIEQQSDISSSTTCEILPSELAVPNCATLLESIYSLDANGRDGESCDIDISSNTEGTTTVSFKTKLPDHESLSCFQNNSSVLTVNNETSTLKSEIKEESYLRIASTVAIKITVKTKSCGLPGVSSERVHYINPNSNGVCLVPISLLRNPTQVQHTSSSSHTSISWDVKYVQFKKKLDTFIKNLRIEEYTSIHEIMLHLMKLYPLYSKDPDFPYCASSEDQFHTWTVGRKLAAEWQRSRQIQLALNMIINLKQMSEEAWSMKDIFRWTRKFGYSSKVNLEDHEEELLGAGGPAKGFGLTSSEELLKILESHQMGNENETKIPSNFHDKLQDVLDIETVKEENEDFHASQLCKPGEDLNRDESIFVHEVLSQICKNFITDILHQSLGESSNRTKNSRSTCITCIDVYYAMQNLSLFDSLTNKNMGIQQLWS